MYWLHLQYIPPEHSGNNHFLITAGATGISEIMIIVVMNDGNIFFNQIIKKITV